MSETSSSSSRQPHWKRYAVGGALLAAGVAGGSALGNTMMANADTATGTAAHTTTTSTAPSAVAINPTDGSSTAAPADSTAATGTTATEGAETADGADTEAADGADTETNDGSQPERSDETALTGADADKVTAAALAQYPGATVDRVETDSDGAYEAHLKTTDGQDLEVQVGADFTVTGVQTHEQQ